MSHTHRLVPWVTFNRAPTGPFPEHTTVVALMCLDCGQIAFFPPDNWALVTPAFRTLVEQLAEEARGFIAGHR